MKENIYLDLSRPELQKAMELAIVLVEHCREYNIPEDSIIYNVAINATLQKEISYVEGKEYQKNKIKQLLGL